ncbi:MAG TPA: alpha-L-arabinofuranosidase C-terminal domain-containing protein [Verrucomicrobiota bacterium]|nr:alpha-L-arabinofuranosidase C-terminal domain-containing protein [Verrucomicrobiota bacterium]
MRNRLSCLVLGGASLVVGLCPHLATAGDQPEVFALRKWTETPDRANAVLTIRADLKAQHRVPKFITGKFAEHLGWNINNGMCAQILRNPTFADYPFWTGQMTPDGLTKFHVDDARITEEMRRLATRFGWPDRELENLSRSRSDSLACLWGRIGERENVDVSPDTAKGGNRGQRVHVKRAGCGIAQWTWLPLHRVRNYEFEIYARSPDLTALRVKLAADEPNENAVAAVVANVGPDWRKLRGTLRVPEAVPEDKPMQFSVCADSPGQFVIGHAFLYPADHVNGADPDVIRFLKDSRLPILRWPGGNFVSTYHWEDGVGPMELRPTLPNFAWGGVEPNLFGTDEFIEFCRAVSCEPMICINAGSGTPEEAARWVEYCNGALDTPMGRLRAANGHPEPYRVMHWEIGNELWGRWQYRWTTASGYVDRLKVFARAMRAADPKIRLYACGAPVFWGKDWNDTLVNAAPNLFDATTDHPLIGGNVDLTTDPMDVYMDFMAVPEVLEHKWKELRDTMLRAGIAKPRLAVTELQVFAHLGSRPDNNQPVRLTRQNLPDQDSITEAVYDILVYHAALRLGSFVEMVTHSAIVNHGGGLRKERERVYANPCHYAQSMFAALAGATPIAVEIQCAAQKAPRVLPDLRGAASECYFSVVDALAAETDDGSVLVSMVNRGVAEPVRLQVRFKGFAPGQHAKLERLEGTTPSSGNTLDDPKSIAPADSVQTLKDERLELELRPFAVYLLHVPSANAPATK